MKRLEFLLNTICLIRFMLIIITGWTRFCKTAIDTLNKIAPIKKKYARGNQMPFMTKELSKEIILRSKLRISFL